MATNRSLQTKRRAAANGARTERTATGPLRKQVKKLSKDLKAIGGTARDVAQERIGQFGENASEMYGQGRDRAHRAKRTLEQFILEQPLKSLLIAGGVGLLLGGYWMRR